MLRPSRWGWAERFISVTFYGPFLKRDLIQAPWGMLSSVLCWF